MPKNTSLRILFSVFALAILFTPEPGHAASAITNTNKAAANVNAGKYDKGIKFAKKAIKKDPGYAFAWFWLGSAHWLKDDWKGAIEAYERRISLDPKTGNQYSEALNRLGIAYFNTGQYEKAILQFRNAKELRPDDENPVANLKYAENAKFIRDINGSIDKNDYIRAIGLLQRVYYSSHTPRPEWRFFAGKLMVYYCNPRAARTYFQDAHLEQENFPEVVTGWLAVTYVQDRDETALKRLRGGLGYLGFSYNIVEGQAVIVSVDPDTPAARAGLQKDDQILQVAGEPVEDYNLHSMIASFSPGSQMTLRVRRGETVLDLPTIVGNFMDHGPHLGNAYACRAQELNREGLALVKSRNLAEALDKFENAIAVAPGPLPKAHFNIALIAEQTGDVAKAVQHYTEAHDTFLLPDDKIDALSRLVALTRRAGVPVAEAAERRWRIGNLRATQKRYVDAIGEFEAAIAESPWLLEAYNDLGLMYDFNEDYGAALRTLNLYIRLKPDAVNIDEAKFKVIELEDRLGLLDAGAN